MSDDPVPTKTITIDGTELEFQEYFVPRTAGAGGCGGCLAAAVASPAPGVVESIEAADVVVLLLESDRFDRPDPGLGWRARSPHSASPRLGCEPDSPRRALEGTGRSAAVGDGGQGQCIRR